MASTYSTNLGIELIGTGDQSGTWGATTNTNFGTLVEQAIVGYSTQAVTDSGTATVLTIANGASSTGRNYVIELTGALTTDRTVTVPAVNKPYVFFNNTSGGFSVTVKVAGQTGVTIKNGRKAIVYTNTTDVIEIANSPVTQDGTLTLTNKTLTSPVIGTVIGGTSASSSLTLQSTSGVGTTDSILFKVGNNGATTAMTVDTSGNVGIGTASPSAKLDVYTNAAAISYIYGRNTLSTSLYGVDASGAGYSYILSSTAGSAANMYVGTAAAASTIFITSGSERMRIDSSGNVGIGTSSPSYKLSVNGTTVGSTVWANVNNTDTTSGSAAGYFASNGAVNAVMYSSSNGGGGTYGMTTNHPMTLITNNTERMRIDTSGNVGIGTSSPNNSLTVSRAGADVARFLNSGTNGGDWQLKIGGGGFEDRKFMIADRYSGADNVRMAIDSSGNVGIGTSSPAAKLQIEQNQAAYTYCDLVNTTNGGGAIFRQIVRNIANTSTTSVDYAKLIGSGLAINNNDTNAANFTAFGVGASERMRIDSSGNVGIGTSSPSANLDVTSTSTTAYSATAYNGAAARMTLRGGSATNAFNAIRFTAGSGNEAIFGTVQESSGYPSFVWQSYDGAYAERMRIDSSGGVRIATTANIFNAASSEKLSVKNTVLGCAATFQTTDVTGGYPILYLSSTDTVNASQNTILFYRGASSVGSIGTTASATTYNTSSDYRLKENVAPITTGLATVSALKPVTYDWVGTNENGEGFIAHELQEVIPLAVTGEKDAVNEDGSIKPQGVDYSKIVVHLVAAIQELEARLAKLETVQ